MAAMLVAATATMAQNKKTAQELRIYINPGHGSWGPNDRPMATIPYPALDDGRPDTCGFYESNTDLWKCLELGRTLQRMGVKKDNIMFSRTKNGPFPYVKGAADEDKYNRSLSEICEEVDANNMDMFISIHSNSASEGSNTNYPLYLYRGTDDQDYVEGSKAMAAANWTRHWEDALDPQSYYGLDKPNLRGDITFYGSSTRHGTKGDYTGYLGVLKHGVPGFLLEGFFHTYQPARHRALNKDWCGQEGVRVARGVCDYFGLTPEKTGYIMGTVKDLHEKMVHNLYHYAPGTDDAAVANRNAAADGDISTDPAVIADNNRLCIFIVVHAAAGLEANVALCWEHGVHGRQQAAIRPEKNIIADRHRAAVEHCKVKIRVAVLTEAGENAVVEINGSLQKQSRLRVRCELCQYLAAQLGLIFIGVIIPAAELVRLEPQLG